MRWSLVLAAALAALAFAPFEREVPENRDGVARYEEKKYDEAGEKFKQGAERREESTELAYNLGAALLRKGDADGARKAWESALAKNPSPELKARIYDGLGVAAATKQQYREAAEFFRRSLQQHPDRDTAANLEIVRRLLKEQEKQQEQQQQQQNQQQDQKQDQQQQQQQEDKKEQQQQAAKAEKDKRDKDKKDKAQVLAPFRKRKDLQVNPFMLEKQGEPQGGQIW